MIDVIKESDVFEHTALELCIFCGIPTAMRNEKENKPVCDEPNGGCAKVRNQKDVEEHSYDYDE